MPHDSPERNVSPEELAQRVIRFARFVDQWPESADFNHNIARWLEEVLSREKRYFDAKYDQTGGLLPSESLARAEIYFSPIRSATREQIVTLRTALETVLQVTVTWKGRMSDAVRKAHDSAASRERARRRFRQEQRRRTMLVERYEYCEAFLHNLRHVAQLRAAECEAADNTEPQPVSRSVELRPAGSSPAETSVHRAAEAAQEESHG